MAPRLVEYVHQACLYLGLEGLEELIHQTSHETSYSSIVEIESRRIRSSRIDRLPRNTQLMHKEGVRGRAYFSAFTERIAAVMGQGQLFFISKTSNPQRNVATNLHESFAEGPISEEILSEFRVRNNDDGSKSNPVRAAQTQSCMHLCLHRSQFGMFIYGRTMRES